MSDEMEAKGAVVVDSPLPSEGNPIAQDPTEIVDPSADQEWNLGEAFPERGESEKTQATSETPAENDGFTPELLDYAAQFGYEKQDFATPQQLTKAIESLHKILAPRPAGQEKQPPALAPQPAPSPVQPRPDRVGGGAAFEFKIPDALLDTNQYDPEVVAFAKAVKAQHEHLQGRLSEVDQLRGLVGQVLDSTQASQTERYFDDVDKLFASDEAMADTFGTGNRFVLPNGPALEARRAVIDQMGVAAGVYHQQGKPVPSTNKLYAIAKSVLHSDKTQQIARRQIADRLRDNKGKFTAPPVHTRKGDLPHGPDRAVAAVAKHLRDNPMFEATVDTGLD